MLKIVRLSPTCKNFKNHREVWSIINGLTGKIIKCIDDIIKKNFKMHL